MGRPLSFFMTVIGLFVVLPFFQNCGGSDFNVDEYTQSSLTSGIGSTTIPLSPTILNKTGDLVLNPGQSAIFSVNSAGTAPLTFEWYRNNQLIAGAQESTYTISSTQTSDSGTYAVLVKNSAGSISTTFQLTVLSVAPTSPPLAAPVITTAPIEFLYINQGQAIQLQVVAAGANLNYQWHFQPVNSTLSSPIIGATSSVYTKINASFSHTGIYSVTVSNSSGSVTANSYVEVDPEPLPLRVVDIR